MASTDTKLSEHRGVPLCCAHCGFKEFRVREYALRTVEDELLRQSWATDQVKAYICTQCGGVLWFA